MSLLGACAAACWAVVLGLGDAAVIYHSTTHNPTGTTLAIAAGMVIADFLATVAAVVVGVVFNPEYW